MRHRSDLAASISGYADQIERECDVKLILRYQTLPGAAPQEGLQCTAVAVLYGPEGCAWPITAVCKRSANSSTGVVQATMMRVLTAVLGALLTYRAASELDVRACGFEGLDALK